MRIRHLKLLNFRNHKEIELDFINTNLVFGINGSGKTSLLEAILLLSTSRSPRTPKNSDLINFTKEKAFLEIILIDQNKKERIIRLELNRRNKNKIFSLDSVVVEPKNVVGFFKTVYFSPETLNIITGSPQERRRFVDILLSQINSSYLMDLIEYKKILINRNKLLKEIALQNYKNDEIIFWNSKLIEFGSRIMRARKEALEKLSRPLEFFYQTVIGKKNHKLVICYHPSFVIDKNNRNIESLFTKKIAGEFDFELRYGSTLYGPHRDDIHFYYQGREATTFCSRGEVRSIVVALKMAEADYIQEKSDDEPVILLDDIFSELDERRAEALSNLVLGNFQSIITSTEKGLKRIFKGNRFKIINLNRKKVYV